MKFYFCPKDEEVFKKTAVGKFVRTIIFDPKSGEIVNSFSRKVSKYWEQTRKNNIETDHRVKSLTHGEYQIYSWVATDSKELGIPGFFAEN